MPSVTERRVADDERLGGIIGQLLRAAREELSLSAEQQAAAPSVVQRHPTLMAQRTESWA
jgi:hypothetical protein